MCTTFFFIREGYPCRHLAWEFLKGLHVAVQGESPSNTKSWGVRMPLPRSHQPRKVPTPRTSPVHNPLLVTHWWVHRGGSYTRAIRAPTNHSLLGKNHVKHPVPGGFRGSPPGHCSNAPSSTALKFPVAWRRVIGPWGDEVAHQPGFFHGSCGKRRRAVLLVARVWQYWREVQCRWAGGQPMGRGEERASCKGCHTVCSVP